MMTERQVDALRSINEQTHNVQKAIIAMAVDHRINGEHIQQVRSLLNFCVSELDRLA